jgi:hypothetical protein
MLVLLTFLVRKRIALKEDVEKTPTFTDKIFLYQKDLLKKSWFVWFILLYAIFAGTIFTLDSVKEKYINNAITNFEQLSKIVRPYISEEDNIKYVSIFSQIKNKDDYVNLISKLQNIAKDNKQSTPEFNFTF